MSRKKSQAIKEYPEFKKEPIHGLTDNQKKYIKSINTYTLTFATGCAGTGKTYIAASLAAQMLESKKINKIIITRPAIEAGENLGFLPGTMEEKYDPYLQPFYSVFFERLGRSFTEYLVKNKTIEAMPLAYMRGTTFKDAFVILDEAQNTTATQMKMFLTRIGINCKVVVNGDTNQKDIKVSSGLEDAVSRLSYIPEVSHIHFNLDDIVRSGLASEIVQAYSQNVAKPFNFN